MADLTLQHDGSPFAGSVQVPGDKSLSHRALIMAAMATGASSIHGLGPGEDITSTRTAITHLGVSVSDGVVRSSGFARWRAPVETIDAGNSGTTLRLLAGALAGRPFASTLSGDDSLQRRPMRRLVAPLTALGATVQLSEAGTAPVTVAAPNGLRGTSVVIPMASAQVRSAFTLAALQAEGASEVDSPPGFRDHTERWLTVMGLGGWKSETAFAIRPGPVPPTRFVVPGDPSSAAYLWAAAALCPGAEITTPGVSLNQGRIGVLDILARMGAQVEISQDDDVLGDPTGTVRVVGSRLVGVQVGGKAAVHALDELPLVAVVAAAGEGLTAVRDAEELTAKESDRIATTVEMVRALGGQAEATADGFEIVGSGELNGGTVDSHGDHRIAMSAAVAATVARKGVTVLRSGAADVSWPGFYDELVRLWSSR